jgi:hypothetical protein
MWQEACRRCRDVLRQEGLGTSLTTVYWLPREQQAGVIVGLLKSICAVSNGLRRCRKRALNGPEKSRVFFQKTLNPKPC